MEFGWEAQQVQADAPNVVETAAQAGASVIVLDGPQLSEQALIIVGRYPQTYFIALHPVAGDLPANLVAFTEARTDQAAFLAGMAAGFATAKKYVVVIGDPTTSEGLKSTNGFLHGARYACPKCRVETVAVTGDLEKDKASVVIYANSGADVFFAAAGVPDELMLRATESEAWVIGWGGDVYMTAFESGNHPGAGRVLTSVFLDPSTALYTALTAYHAGAPLTGAHPPSAANGAVGIALYRSPSDALSPFDKQAIETALNQLADGSLDPGIDPVTGEEK